MLGLMQRDPLLISSLLTFAARHHASGEIVSDGKDGLLWSTEEQLVRHTRDLIESPQRRAELARAAVDSSKRFDVVRFRQRIREILFS